MVKDNVYLSFIMNCFVVTAVIVSEDKNIFPVNKRLLSVSIKSSTKKGRVRLIDALEQLETSYFSETFLYDDLYKRD